MEHVVKMLARVVNGMQLAAAKIAIALVKMEQRGQVIVGMENVTKDN
jgi:hypothetical protein